METLTKSDTCGDDVVDGMEGNFIKFGDGAGIVIAFARQCLRMLEIIVKLGGRAKSLLRACVADDQTFQRRTGIQIPRLDNTVSMQLAAYG